MKNKNKLLGFWVAVTLFFSAGDLLAWGLPEIKGTRVQVRTSETRIRVGNISERVKEVKSTSTNAFRPLDNLRGTQIFLNGNFGWNGGNSPYADGFYHEGSDFGCREGVDPIYAIHDGEVVYAEVETKTSDNPEGVVLESSVGFGSMIILEGGGIQSKYAHLHSFSLKEGDKVKKGDVVGICGNTGFSTGPHLHLECRENGVLVRCYDLVMGDTQKFHDSAQNACESLGYSGCRETMDALDGKSVDFFQLLAFSGNSEGIKTLKELESRNLYSISPKATDLGLSTEDWRRKRVALMHQFYRGLNPSQSTTQITDSNRNEWVEKINAHSVRIGSPLGDQYGQVFVDVGEKYGVHPYFIVAVAQADTSLGKHLTTPFNIGNVGNTDSCPTCQKYTSWNQGIDAVGRTLANQYLGNKTKVCEFSRGGTCHHGRFFYASSMENWNRNATITYSQLLGVGYNDQLCVRLSCFE